MRNYNTNSNKSDGFTTSPVTVELNGRSIEAVHHFTNETDTLLNLYIDTREGGIDVVIPLASDKPAYALSERGEEVLGFTEDRYDRVDENADRELMTDGGEPIDDTDSDERDADVWICDCGDNLAEIGTLEIVKGSTANLRDPTLIPSPDVVCDWCGASVSGRLGVHATYKIWQERGESVPDSFDDVASRAHNASVDTEQLKIDDFGDGRLVTDGGEPIDNESDESGNVSKDDFEGVDSEGANNEVNETHDRVEYAEHPPVDLPGAGPYTPGFTDVDVTPVGDGDE